MNRYQKNNYLPTKHPNFRGRYTVEHQGFKPLYSFVNKFYDSIFCIVHLHYINQTGEGKVLPIEELLYHKDYGFIQDFTSYQTRRNFAERYFSKGDSEVGQIIDSELESGIQQDKLFMHPTIIIMNENIPFDTLSSYKLYQKTVAGNYDKWFTEYDYLIDMFIYTPIDR